MKAFARLTVMLAVSTIALGLTPAGSYQAHAQRLRPGTIREERELQWELRRLRRHAFLREQYGYCCEEHRLEARLREERIRREERREERRREYRRRMWRLRRQIEREALGEIRWPRGRGEYRREPIERPRLRGYDETMRPLPGLPEFPEEVSSRRGTRRYR
jgi:hypothetical protein